MAKCVAFMAISIFVFVSGGSATSSSYSSFCRIDTELEWAVRSEYRVIGVTHVWRGHICVYDESSGKVLSELSVENLDGRGIAIRGNYLYVSDSGLYSKNPGIVIIDISPDKEPSVVSRVRIKGSAEGMTFDGQLAYLTSPEAGLIIFDASSPGALKEIGSFSDDNWPFGFRAFSAVHVINKFAYITGWTNNHTNIVEILDVSSPSNPRKLSKIEVEIGSGAGATAIYGHYLYIGTVFASSQSVGKIYVIDIEDTNDPKVVNVVEIPTRSNRLSFQVQSNLLIVGDDSSWPSFPWKVYELSDPLRPKFIKEIEGSWANRISFFDELVYRGTKHGFKSTHLNDLRKRLSF